MAYTVGLMEGVRHVVREGALLKDPLAVGSNRGDGYEQERNLYFPIHKLCLEL